MGTSEQGANSVSEHERLTDHDGIVTIVVGHRVRPGKEAEFEEWLRGVSRAAIRFPGHMGFNIVRPSDLGRLEYVVFFRFDSFSHLEEWEHSDARRQWLDRLEPLTFDAPQREQHTGWEVWFTPPPGRGQPPRYKMVIVTLLALYPLVTAVQLMTAELLSRVPLLLRTLLTSAVLVCLMTYVVMPSMTRVFSRGLYGPPVE